MRPSMLLKRKEKWLLRFYKSIFGKVILLFVGLAISALVFLSLSRSVVAVNSAVFGQPVQVTSDPGKGYEPAVVVDPYGNIFATAHKENWQLVLGPDPNSPTFTRSMSWAWYSDDGGRTFNDLPGLTALSLEQHEFGDEGDMAVDDADHLYFVDTNVVDDTITRWNVTDHGRQFMTLDYTRPLIPTMQAVDDRPWVTAHGDGHVFYFGNEGDKVTYPLGQGQGSGFGPGRYTVYSSYDGGRNFNPFGYTLRDSGWCRPAADHQSGSPYIIAVCGNDGGSNDVFTANNPKGSLYAYVSADDGQTFERFKVGNYQSFDSTFSWPTVSFARDGSIWALYVDAGNLDPTTCSTDPFGVTSCNPTSNRIMLYHSTDHGRSWSSQNITPLLGRYRYGWLAVSPDGRRLGLGIYYRPNETTPWRVYGAIWTPGQKPTLVSLDENNPVASATSEAPGDLMGSYFNPDGTLNVVWTRTDPPVVAVRINRTILFARSVTR